MFDIVIPNGNEDAFVATAKKLGYRGLIFAYASKQAADRAPPVDGIIAKKAVLAEPRQARPLRQQGMLTLVHSSDQDRSILEQGAADVLFGLEHAQPKDYMHQRGAGLNQVLCALAHKNKTAIGFSVADILAAHGSERAKILGRMTQNIEVCRKYKVKIIIASFARDPWQMRSAHDLQSLFVTLGMHAAEAKTAFSGL